MSSYWKHIRSAGPALIYSVGRRLPSRPVFVGALLTVLTTHALFVLPPLVAFDKLQQNLYRATGFWLRGNPFSLLQYLGGIAGGYTAGYLTDEFWHRSFVNGLKAVLFGIGIYYLVRTVWHLVSFFLATELTETIALVIVIQPFIFLFIPFGALYLIQSSFSSLLGHLTSRVTSSRYPSFGLQVFVATIAFLGLFTIVWAFVFFVQGQY